MNLSNPTYTCENKAPDPFADPSLIPFPRRQLIAMMDNVWARFNYGGDGTLHKTLTAIYHKNVWCQEKKSFGDMALFHSIVRA